MRDLQSRRQDASTKISALARGRKARRRTYERQQEQKAAILIQRTARGRRGRNRAKTSADQRAIRENAATKIQKVAREKSKRALFRQGGNDFNDRGLYGTKSDARECGTFAGAAPSGKESVLPCERQQESPPSLRNDDGPKRVGFATNSSASEEAVALVALDLDERVRSFVATQATVRRFEANTAQATASRTAPARSESNDADDESDNHNRDGHDLPLNGAEIDHNTQREQDNLSESDFAMSLSLSESGWQDVGGGEHGEGWKSDFELDFKSDFVLDDTSRDALAISERAQNGADKPLEDEAENPDSLTKWEKEEIESGFNRDGELEGHLAVLEDAQRGEREEHEAHPTLSEQGSEDDGASAIAGELIEVAIWEAKVALFLESRPESEQEASEPSSPPGSTANEGVSADGAIPMSTDSAGVVAEQPVFATVDNEALPSEAGTMSPTVNTAATVESLEDVEVVERGEIQHIVGDVLVDAGPEIAHEQPVPAAESLVKEGTAVPAGDLDAVERASASVVMPLSSDAAGVDASTAGSKENAHAMKPGDAQSTAADAFVDAGPETDPDKPVMSVEALTGGDGEVPTTGPDTANEANTCDANSVSADSSRVPVEQQVVEAANESNGGQTAPIAAETTPPVVSIGPAASLEATTAAELGGVQPAAGDAQADAGLEAEFEQPALTGEVLVEDDAVEAANADAPKEGAIVAEAPFTLAESAGLDAEQPVVEAANELGGGDAAAAEADTTTSVSNVDLATSLGIARVVDLGDVQPAAAPIDAVLEAGAEHYAQAAKDDEAVLTAVLGGAEGANAGEAIPMAGTDAEQPIVEAATELGGDQTPLAEPDITTPDVSIDPAASEESSKVVELGDVQPAAGDAVVDAGHKIEAEAEQSAPTAEALPEGGAAVPASDPGDPRAAQEGTNAEGAMSTPADSVGVDAEQPVVVPDGDKAPAEAKMVTAADSTGPVVSLENAQVEEPGEIKPTAGDVIVNASPEIELKHAVVSVDPEVGVGAMAAAADPDTTGVTSAGDVMLTASVSVGAEAVQRIVEATNEVRGGDTALVETDTARSPINTDMAGLSESADHADLDDVRRATSNVVVDGPEADAGQSVPAVEARVADPRAADPDVATEADTGNAANAGDEANAIDAVPLSAESATVSAEQPAVEPETTTESVVATAGSTGVSQEVEPGDVQPAAGDALVDAGAEAQAEQPAPAAKAQAKGGGVATAGDAGATEGVTAGEVVPMAIVSAEVEPAVELAREPTGDEPSPAEANTLTPDIGTDPAESSKVADLGDVQPTTGNTLVDAGLETEAGQPVPTTEALVGDDAAVQAEDSEAVGEANTGDEVPTSAESAGVDAEQPAVEAVIEPVSDDSSPVKANTTALAVSIDTPESFDVQPAADDESIDAGPETGAEQLAPATEALAGGDLVVPTADSDAVGEVKAGDEVPTPAEPGGVDAELLAVEAASEPTGDDSSPVEADIATPDVNIDAPIDAGPETEADQLAPANEDDEVVPAVDPSVVGEANAGGAVPTSAESVKVDAKQPAVDSGSEPGGGDTAPQGVDTATPDVNMDPAASLERSRVADLGDAQPDSGDELIDAGPETEAEQLVPAAEALVEGGEVVPAADPGAVGEASVDDAVLTPAESLKVDAQQPAVKAAKEPSSGDTVPPEADTSTACISTDTPGSLESCSRVAHLGDVQPTVNDVTIDAGPETGAEQPAPASEDDDVVPAAAPGVVGEAYAGEAMPTSTESVKVDVEQPVIEAANEPGSGDTASVEADITTFAVSIDPATSSESIAASFESAKVVELLGVQSASGDALIDAGHETEAEREQSAPTAETPPECGAAVQAADPHAAQEGAAAEGSMSTPASGKAVAEAEMVVAAVDGDVAGSLKSQVVEADEVQPTVGDAAINADREAETEQPVLSVEPEVGPDAMAAAADPDTVGVARAGDFMTTASVSAEVEAVQPVAEAADELRGDDTAPVEIDTTTPPALVDTPGSFESAHEVESGELHPAADDSPVDADPETEAAQPAPAAEAPAEDDAEVPVADPHAIGEASTSDVMPTSTEVTQADTEHVAVEAANGTEEVNQTGSADTTPAEVQTESSVLQPDVPETDAEQVTVEAANRVEVVDHIASADTAPTEALTEPSVLQPDARECLESAYEAEPGETYATAGDAVIDAYSEAEAEQPLPAAETLMEGGAGLTAADSDAVEEAATSDVIPTPAEAAGVDAEQTVVEAANDLGGGDTAPLEADTTPPTVSIAIVDTPGSSESAHEVESGEFHSSAGDAGDALVDAGLEIEAEQPVPAAEALAEDFAGLLAADPDAVGQASISDVRPTPAEAVAADVEQSVVERTNEIGSGDTAPAEPDTTASAVSTDTPGSLEATKVAEVDGVQPIVGDVVVDPGPEKAAEQPAPTAEARADGDGVALAPDRDAPKEGANADETILMAEEPARADVEQPTVEAVKELGGGDTASVEAGTTPPVVSVDPVASLESTMPAAIGDVQPAIGDAIIEAGPNNETEPEQPIPPAEVLVEGGEALTVEDPDAGGEASTRDVMPTSDESDGANAEQAEVEPANVLSVGGTAPVATDTTTPAYSIDPVAPLESTKAAALGGVRSNEGDALNIVGPGFKARQPVPAAKAFAEEHAGVSAANPDAAEEVSVSDMVQTLAEAAGADTERPVVEVATDLGGGDTAPVEAKTESAVRSNDTVEPLESAQEVEPGDICPGAGDAAIDAGPETEAEQPVPAAEALVEDDAVMPVADSNGVDEATASDMMPMSAESDGANAQPPGVEAANELSVGGKALVETDTTTLAVNVDTSGSLESTHEVESGELHPVTDDALIDPSPDIEAAQPVPAAEALVEDDATMPAADPDDLEEASTSGVTPPPAEEAGVDAERLVVEAATDLGGGDPAPIETDTTTPGSLESALHPTAGDALIDSRPDTEDAQPVPPAETLVEDDAAVIAADPDAVGEASTSDTMPTSAEAAGAGAERPVVEPANELTVNETAAVETNTTTTAASAGPATPVESIEIPDSIPAAEALVDGDGVAPAADPDAATEGANADETVPMATESAEVGVEQPVVEAANESDGGQTARVEAETTPPVVSTDPATPSESTKAAELDGVQPTAGDALVDPGLETEPERPAPTAEALAEDDAWRAAAPDVPTDGAVGLDAEQPDMAGSLGNAKLADLDDTQGGTSEAPVDARPQSGRELPVPAAKAVVEDVKVGPPADPDTTGGPSAGNAVSTSADSGFVSTEQPIVETANELGSSDTSPAEVNTTTSTSNVDLPRSLESDKNVEPGESQPPSVDVDELFGVEAPAVIPEDSSADAIVTVSAKHRQHVRACEHAQV